MADDSLTSTEDPIVQLIGDETIQGTSLTDLIGGTNRDDVLLTGGGVDVVFGSAGNDIIDTGAGDDYVFGGSGNSTIIGGEGGDNLNGGQGVNLLLGGVGNDTLVGAGSDDTIYGGADNDRIFGGDGTNTLIGGAGADEIVGGGSADHIYIDLGAENFVGDSIDGAGGDDTVFLLFDEFDTLNQFDAAVQSEGSIAAALASFGFVIANVETFEIIPIGLAPVLQDISFEVSEDDGLTTLDLAEAVVDAVGTVFTAGGITFLQGELDFDLQGSDFLFDAGDFDFLRAESSATVTFQFELADAQNLIGTAEATVTITGENDPVVIDLQSSVLDTTVNLGGGFAPVISLVDFEGFLPGTPPPFFEPGIAIEADGAQIAEIVDSSDFTQIAGVLDGNAFALTDFGVLDFEDAVDFVQFGIAGIEVAGGSVAAFDTDGNLVERLVFGTDLPTNLGTAPALVTFTDISGAGIDFVEIETLGSDDVLIDNIQFGDNPDLSGNTIAGFLGFDEFAPGTLEPVSDGFVTVTSGGGNQQVQNQAFAQFPGVFEGNFFGFAAGQFFIDFEAPVDFVSFGLFDPNTAGGTVSALDVNGNTIQTLEFGTDIPLGPPGGSFSTPVAFSGDGVGISRIEVSTIGGDLTAIDSIFYQSFGATGSGPVVVFDDPDLGDVHSAEILDFGFFDGFTVVGLDPEDILEVEVLSPGSGADGQVLIDIDPTADFFDSIDPDEQIDLIGTVEIFDEDGASDSADFSITVTNQDTFNDPPVLLAAQSTLTASVTVDQVDLSIPSGVLDFEDEAPGPVTEVTDGFVTVRRSDGFDGEIRDTNVEFPNPLIADGNVFDGGTGEILILFAETVGTVGFGVELDSFDSDAQIDIFDDDGEFLESRLLSDILQQAGAPTSAQSARIYIDRPGGDIGEIQIVPLSGAEIAVDEIRYGFGSLLTPGGVAVFEDPDGVEFEDSFITSLGTFQGDGGQLDFNPIDAEVSEFQFFGDSSDNTTRRDLRLEIENNLFGFLGEGETVTAILPTAYADDLDQEADADFTFTFIGVNDAPLAVPDFAATDEDTPITINVIGNDIDLENDALSILSIDGVVVDGSAIELESGAFVSVGPGQSLSYDPQGSAQLDALNTGESFVETFEVVIQDTGGLTSTATVEIDVSGVTDVATSSVTLFNQFDPAEAGSLFGLSSSPDGVEIATLAQSRNTVDFFTPQGEFLRSIPKPGEAGNDGDLDYFTTAGTLNGVSIPAGTLLVMSGDSGTADLFAVDPQTGDILASLVTDFGNSFTVGAAHNPVTNTFFLLTCNCDADGNVIAEIDPTTGETLSRIDLDPLGFQTFFGDIDVDPATGDLFVVSDQADDRILRLSTDGAPLEDFTLPANVLNLSGISVVAGSPAEFFVGSTSGAISQLIEGAAPINFDPVAVDDIAATNNDATVIIDVGANDFDPNGDPLSFELFEGALGSVIQVDDGVFQYDPDGQFDGLGLGESDEDSFTYVVQDDNGGLDYGIVTITVNGTASAVNSVVASNDGGAFPGFSITSGIDLNGYAVAGLGDVNGDGFDDVAIGAPAAYGYVSSDLYGAAYVVFGGPDVSFIRPEDLNGSNGFRVNGAGFSDVGLEVADAGDFNGDGLADFFVSTDVGSGGGGAVIFGTDAGFPEEVDLADLGAAGVTITSSAPITAGIGFRADSIGDFNGDNIDDLLVDGDAYTSGAYAGPFVIFGSSDPGASIDLSELDGTNGFAFGSQTPSLLGLRDVAGIGDINGDGAADLAFSRIQDISNPGEVGVAVVFGGEQSFPAVLNAADAPGIDFVGYSYSQFGRSISGGGDINGDGIDDLVVGAPNAEVYYSSYGGAAFVLFGSRTLGATVREAITVDELNGSNGFIVDAPSEGADAGYAVDFIGDFNGDGIDDLAIGAPDGGSSGYYGSTPGQNGEVIILFGRNTAQTGEFDQLVETAGVTDGSVIRFDGVDIFSDSGRSVSGGLDLNGDGISDLIFGAPNFIGERGSYYDANSESIVLFGSEAFTDLDLGNPPDGLITSDEIDAALLASGEITTDENTALVIDTALLTANDFDPNGDPFGIQSIDGQSAAGATISVDGGEITYDPSGVFDLDFGEVEIDIFTYTIVDDGGATDTAIVTVLVTDEGSGSGGPVQAFDDAFTVQEDALLEIDEADLLSNDINPLGGGLSIIDFSTASPGTTLEFNGGLFEYLQGGVFEQLSVGDTASDSFTYTVTNGDTTSTATVTLTIEGQNDPVEAGDDVFTIGENGFQQIAALNFLANDIDPDENDLLEIIGFNATTLGASVELSGNQVIYDLGPQEQLDQGDVLVDSFQYTVSDGTITDQGNVQIRISGENDPVVAFDDAADATGTGITEIAESVLLANDVDPDASALLDIVEVGSNANSTTSAQGATVTLLDGLIQYDPGSIFAGLTSGQTATDSFTYTVEDQFGLADQAVVTLTIMGNANSPVTAVDDTADTDEDTLIQIAIADLIANDLDGDNDPLFFAGFSATSAGGVTLTADEFNITYDPAGFFDDLSEGESATDTFTYNVTDNNGSTDTATVTITIDGLNDLATAVADEVSAFENTPLSISFAELLGNDFDPDDADVLTIIEVSSESDAGATVTLGSDGILYDLGTVFDELQSDDTEFDSFTYTISDGNGSTSTAIVDVEVNGENDAPRDQRVFPRSIDLASENSDGTNASNNQSLAITKISADGNVVAFASFATDLVTGDSNSREDLFVRDLTTGVTERINVESLTGDQSSAAVNQQGFDISGDGNRLVFATNATDLGTSPATSTTQVFLRDREAGTTELVSLSDTGEALDNFAFQPSISDDGQFVTFISDATNAITGLPGFGREVYRRNVETGEVDLVTADENGNRVNSGITSDPVISGDGSVVVFRSTKKLVASDPNDFGADIYVRDFNTGTTEIISINDQGVPFGGNTGTIGAISADGRFVVFTSNTPGIVDGDDGIFTDVFVVDRGDPEDPGDASVELISRNFLGLPATGASQPADISADGRFVTFQSSAEDLVVGDTNGVTDVFRHDRETGITELISVADDGTQTTSSIFRPAISADGQTIAFASGAGEFDPLAIGGQQQTFVSTISDIFTFDAFEGGDPSPQFFDLLDGFFDPEGDELSALGIEVVVAGDPGRDVSFFDASGGLIEIDPLQFSDLATGTNATLEITWQVIDDAGDSISASAEVTVIGTAVPNTPVVAVDDAPGPGTGFTVIGAAEGDQSGYDVAGIGDINGDGINDFAIGAPYAVNTYGETVGAAYVVFGRSAGIPDVLDLATIGGRNGFAIEGLESGDNLGTRIARLDDINGDGVGDFAITAYDSTGPGRVFVIFGQDGGFGSGFDLATLDGTNGFEVTGSENPDIVNPGRFGTGLAGADLNGDGFDDLIIGAPNLSTSVYSYGKSYVLFSSADGFEASISVDELNGTNGFALSGHEESRSGQSIASAGDFNYDGVEDIIIGAPGTVLGSSDYGEGSAFVVFGSTEARPAEILLENLNGSDGIALTGEVDFEQAGFSVSGGGDFNGDGIADVIIGNAYAENSYTGLTYVVFGSDEAFDPVVGLSADALDGNNGFVIEGADPFDAAGRSVANIGDVNGDELDDILVGAYYTSVDGSNGVGQSYIIFGSESGFGGSIAVADLDGSNGLILNGVAASDYSGYSVSGAGDVNGDGIGDILIGAFRADPSGRNAAGETYVLFGDQGLALADGDDDGVIALAELVARTGTDFTTLNTATLEFFDIDLLANDIDPDPDFLTITAIDAESSSGAAVSFDPLDGTITYDPSAVFAALEPGQTVVDTFQYTVSDGQSSDTATVSIEVTGAPPAAMGAVPPCLPLPFALQDIEMPELAEPTLNESPAVESVIELSSLGAAPTATVTVTTGDPTLAQPVETTEVAFSFGFIDFTYESTFTGDGMTETYTGILFGGLPFELSGFFDSLNTLMIDSQATGGDDLILGTARDDVIIAGFEGEDVLRGLFGSDLYIIAKDSGRVEIDDGAAGGADIARFYALSSDSADFARGPDFSDDLIISSSSGLEVVVRDTLSDNPVGGIETFEFTDTSLTAADIRARLLDDAATDGDDRIFGFATDDEINGGAGNDILSGGFGDDTFIFETGGETDIIMEHEEARGGTDTVRFVDRAFDDATFMLIEPEFDAVEIGFRNGDRVVVSEALGPNAAVDRFEFEDRVVFASELEDLL
ncbi:MAG: Ig-like domain-containing protein [Pseudomonadota bacterium]